MPAKAGIHDFIHRDSTSDVRPSPIENSSLRGRAAAVAIHLLSRNQQKDGLLRSARNDGVFWLVLGIIVFLATTVSGWAQTKPASLPQKIASNITDMTPIILHPGANTVEFWGSVSYLTWNKSQPDWNNRRIVPFHQSGQIYDFKKFIGTDEYIATVTWINPSEVVDLGNGDTAADQGCWACGMIQTDEFFVGNLGGHKQTFLVTAKRQLTALQPGGDSPSYFTPQPTIITIFAFYGGTPQIDRDKLGDARSFSPPGFVQIDTFESNAKYCQSDTAILVELPFKPALSPQSRKRAIQDDCNI
jgi:hypothetical protein